MELDFGFELVLELVFVLVFVLDFELEDFFVVVVPELRRTVAVPELLTDAVLPPPELCFTAAAVAFCAAPFDFAAVPVEPATLAAPVCPEASAGEFAAAPAEPEDAVPSFCCKAEAADASASLDRPDEPRPIPEESEPESTPLTAEEPEAAEDVALFLSSSPQAVKLPTSSTARSRAPNFTFFIIDAPLLKF